MIRINLLGIPKSKRGKRAAAAASMPSEGPNPVLVGVVMVVVAALLFGYFYIQVTHEHDNLQKALQEAILDNQRLSQVKAIYEQTQRESEQFRRRVQVIDQLQAARSGPVDFLNLVASTINNTDAVWLQAMTDDGKSIDFTGMALSPDAVADLMVNLQKTGLFKTVEIKETSQDATLKEMQAFKFELICEKAPAQPKPENKVEKKTQA